MNEQISLFDAQPNVGALVEKHGRLLSFDEIAARVGDRIVYECSTQSHEWFKIVLVESIYVYPDGHRRLIYFDGHKQRGLVDDLYFKNGSVRAFEVAV